MNNEQIITTCVPLLKREFNVQETNLLLNMDMGRVSCWAVTKRMNIHDKGLLLKVSANHHKGYVFITLGWDDTYEYHLISNRGTLKESIEGIYFDVLTESIDRKIEYVPQYSF